MSSSIFGFPSIDAAFRFYSLAAQNCFDIRARVTAVGLRAIARPETPDVGVLLVALGAKERNGEYIFSKEKILAMRQALAQASSTE